MANVTVTGTIAGATGGSITFELDGHYVDSDDEVQIPRPVVAELTTVGAFSTTLESTTTGAPTTRKYKASVKATINNKQEEYDLPKFALSDSTPQDIKDLVNVTG